MNSLKKRKNIDFEILIYFDYIEGKILKCKLGSETNVKLKFDENEFKGKHVASIHNHTKDMYTPPSDKNFGIFSREWEDFELIAGINKLWILKSKLKDEKLTFELKTSSSILFRIALESASLKYQNQDEIDDECDELYGKLLSNYINDKNINNIQLKQRDILMTENIEYACRKKIRDPKVIEKIRKQAKDPTILPGKEALEALYSQMGMKLNIDEIPSL